MEGSPSKMVERPQFRHDIPESLIRPPLDVTRIGKKPRPKSSIGFGSSQDRFGVKKPAKRGERKTMAELQELER